MERDTRIIAETCTFPGCTDPADAKGICIGHYMQQKRTGELKPIKRHPGRQDPWTKCLLNHCTQVAKSKNLCGTHNAVRHRFKLTPERLVELMNDARCEICNTHENLNLDHDHDCCEGPKTCGECFRGVLCNRCNMGLGTVSDDLTRLRRMVAYLERFEK